MINPEIYLNIIVGIALIVFAYMDIKSKQLPSFLTTSLILVSAIVNYKDLSYGILAFIFGYLLMEFSDDPYLNFMGGIADLKVIVILGLMITSMIQFLVLCLLIVVIGTIYKFVAIKLFKPKELAFIPSFLIVFLLMKLFEVML